MLARKVLFLALYDKIGKISQNSTMSTSSSKIIGIVTSDIFATAKLIIYSD